MDTSEFIVRVLSNQMNAEILELLPALGLKDTWLVSGALFQSVWNSLSRRPITYGNEDYDIIYFDNRDLSWQADDRVIRRAVDLFKDLKIHIEVRNQARVHLWYKDKFGLPYPKLRNAVESLHQYPATVTRVAVQPSARGAPILRAPEGLEDIETFCVRRADCSRFWEKTFLKKAARWKTVWPEITIEKKT